MIDETMEPLPIEPPPGDPGVPIDFNTFILSLSSSATYFLGLLPHPDTSCACQNLPMAKQTLDILTLLKQKTRGNLTREEEKLLGEVHYSLRIAYVAAAAKCECSGD